MVAPTQDGNLWLLIWLVKQPTGFPFRRYQQEKRISLGKSAYVRAQVTQATETAEPLTELKLKNSYKSQEVTVRLVIPTHGAKISLEECKFNSVRSERASLALGAAQSSVAIVVGPIPAMTEVRGILDYVLVYNE